MTSVPPPGAGLVAAGVRHVRLSFHFLDQDDLDGYGSLVVDDVRLDHPDLPAARGRDEVLVLLRHVVAGRHRLLRIVAAHDGVAVHGTFAPRRPPGRYLGPAPVEFAEFFDLSRDGLFVSCRRFYNGGRRRDKPGIGRGDTLGAFPTPLLEADDDGHVR